MVLEKGVRYREVPLYIILYLMLGTRETYSQNDNHVMISYERESEPLMITVRDELERNGFKVWMDGDDEGRSLQEVMMEGVEEASVVLIGVSRKYKQIPNAFAGNLQD